MTPSHNVRFVGKSPQDDANDSSRGYGIAEWLERALQQHDYSTKLDNWRDCGWAILVTLPAARFEIRFAAMATLDTWHLQIIREDEPGFLARLFGAKVPDPTEDAYKIACVVHKTLTQHEFNDIVWCLDNFPEATDVTSAQPLKPASDLDAKTLRTPKK